MEKQRQMPPRPRNKKAHGQTRPCTQNKNARPKQTVRDTPVASASGVARAQEQRISYLTYPVCAGFTVTVSRGISPHSAASLPKTGTPSCMYLLDSSITQQTVNCKGSCLYFPQKRDAPPQRDASPCIEGPLQALLVGLDHLLDHLAADGTGLAAGKVAVVAVLQVDAHLSRCVFASKI